MPTSKKSISSITDHLILIFLIIMITTFSVYKYLASEEMLASEITFNDYIFIEGKLHDLNSNNMNSEPLKIIIKNAMLDNKITYLEFKSIKTDINLAFSTLGESKAILKKKSQEIELESVKSRLSSLPS